MNRIEKIHDKYHCILPAADSFPPRYLSIAYCTFVNTETIKNNKHADQLYLVMAILIQIYPDMHRAVHLLRLHTVNVRGRQKRK